MEIQTLTLGQLHNLCHWRLRTCSLPCHFLDHEITEKLQIGNFSNTMWVTSGTGNPSGASDYEFTVRLIWVCFPQSLALYVGFRLPLCYIQTFLKPFNVCLNVLFWKGDVNPIRRTYFNTRYIVLLHRCISSELSLCKNTSTDFGNLRSSPMPRVIGTRDD